MNEFLFCSSIPQSSVFTFRLSENYEVCSNIRSLVHLLRNSHASVGLPPVWWAIIIIVATSSQSSSSLQALQKKDHFHMYFHDDHFPLILPNVDQIHEICKCRRLPDGKVAGPIADTSQARKRTIASIPATLFVCQIVSFGCHLEMKNSKHERKRFCYLPRNFALSHSILFYLFSCTSS